MRAIDFIHQFGIFSREAGMPKVASKSEVGRWCKAGAVRINGESLLWNEQVDFPIISLVLFPKGNRVTLL